MDMREEEEEDMEDELLYAARSNDIDAVKTILTGKMCDVNCKDPRGKSTPLHYAAANGHMAIVKLLVDHGGIPEMNGGGNSPLHWACLNDQIAIALYLLKTFPKKLDVLVQNRHGKSALTYGFKTNNTELVE
eukprot:g4721.t1